MAEVVVPADAVVVALAVGVTASDEDEPVDDELEELELEGVEECELGVVAPASGSTYC